MIKPRLIDIELEDEWQEGTPTPFGVNPNVRWFKIYEVYIDIGQILQQTPEFFAHFIVASPGIKRTPPEDLKAELSTACIQEVFDEEEAKKFLEEKLNNITAQSESDLALKVSGFLDILPEL